MSDHYNFPSTVPALFAAHEARYQEAQQLIAQQKQKIADLEAKLQQQSNPMSDDAWGELFAEVRDDILHGRGHLDGVLDNDQTNAVLAAIDRLDVVRTA